MQNTIDVLPIELTQPQVQTRPKGSGTYEGSGFSEAIGSAVDRAAQQPVKNTTDNTTKDKAMPMDDAKQDDTEAIAAEDVAANGSLNIQQIMAGLIIGNANESEAEIPAMQEAEQPILEPETRPAVVVLEGYPTQAGQENIQAPASDSGQAMPAAPQQPEEPEAEAEAWMPIDSGEAETPQPVQQGGQPQQLTPEREIESRLEEHLRPLENDNRQFADAPKPIGDEEITATKEIEIDAKPTKDDQKSIDDIQGEEIAQPITTADESEPTSQNLTDEGSDDGKDAADDKVSIEQPKAEAPQQSEAFAVKQDMQPPKQAADIKSQQVEETIFNRMVEDISTNAMAGRKEFSINLRPDFMGDMNIELVMTEAGLSAKIKAADPQVNSIISQHLFKLEQSLKEQGIDVVNLEVSVFDTGEFGKEDFSRQHGRQDDSKPNSTRIGRVKALAREAIMAAGMETLSESQTVEAMGMGSSVEYKA